MTTLVALFWVLVGVSATAAAYELCASWREGLPMADSSPLAPDVGQFSRPDYAEDVCEQADEYDLDRMREGAAYAEAFALQADEIRSLPEAEPRRTLS